MIRNQQVSGSSPLAGSNGINNLQRSRVQTDPTRVTTVSPLCHHQFDGGSAPPHPRREGRPNSSAQPAHSTRGQPSPPPDRCGTDRRSPRQSEGVRHEPAAGRGGPAGRTLSSVTATPGRTPPLPARTPDPCFRSEERAAGSTANACSPSTGRIHRSVCMRRFPATVGPGDRRAGRSLCARGRRRAPYPPLPTVGSSPRLQGGGVLSCRRAAHGSGTRPMPRAAGCCVCGFRSQARVGSPVSRLRTPRAACPPRGVRLARGGAAGSVVCSALWSTACRL